MPLKKRGYELVLSLNNGPKLPVCSVWNTEYELARAFLYCAPYRLDLDYGGMKLILLYIYYAL